MHYILYIIAFLEGFTTLSVEIMSIRNSVSIIWSNAIATSIILGIILLALSYGYYRGGVLASENKGEYIKKKIYKNLLIASLFYTFVSFPFQNTLLNFFLKLDIGYFLPIFTVISLLFILPVFLASQTIPLLSELIGDEKKAVVIGKLLFFSTIWSFLWSVITSLIFFSFIGVERSIVVNGIILGVLAFIMIFQFEKKSITRKIIVLHGIYLVFLINLLFIDYSRFLPANAVYNHSSEYNDITVFDNGTSRLFMMNGSHSSGLDIASGKSYFSYIKEVTRIIDDERPKKILIIGAAWFSLPQDIAERDFVERIDVSDIDGSLDTIAEKYFLQEKLHPKIHFYKESARHFVNKKGDIGEKYDFIFLDAYSGKLSIPSELLTKDFFESIRRISSGTVAMNLILDKEKTSIFSQKLANTLLASYGSVYYAPMTVNNINYFDNFIVTDRKIPGYQRVEWGEMMGIYTDNQSTLERDKYALFYSQKAN